MLSKLMVLIIILLTVGVALTLTLPEYKIESNSRKTAPKYLVDQVSLNSPYPMKDFLLVAPTPSGAQYALRLGLYHQLQQATAKAKTLKVDSTTQIVKAIDTNREWYVVLLGPYVSKPQAEQKKQWLLNNQISSTLTLWPKTDKSSIETSPSN